MKTKEQIAYLAVLTVEYEKQRVRFSIVRAMVISYLMKQLDKNLVKLNLEGR